MLFDIERRSKLFWENFRIFLRPVFGRFLYARWKIEGDIGRAIHVFAGCMMPFALSPFRELFSLSSFAIILSVRNPRFILFFIFIIRFSRLADDTIVFCGLINLYRNTINSNTKLGMLHCNQVMVQRSKNWLHYQFLRFQVNFNFSSIIVFITLATNSTELACSKTIFL